MGEKRSFLHYDIKLTGAVQGVGLRYSTRRKAGELGIGGFIRNEADGTVTIEAEGKEKNLRDFISWLESGFDHPGYRKIRSQESEPKHYMSFEILR